MSKSLWDNYARVTCLVCLPSIIILRSGKNHGVFLSAFCLFIFCLLSVYLFFVCFLSIGFFVCFLSIYFCMLSVYWFLSAFCLLLLSWYCSIHWDVLAMLAAVWELCVATVCSQAEHYTTETHSKPVWVIRPAHLKTQSHLNLLMHIDSLSHVRS